MATDIICPNCKAEIDMGDYPDNVANDGGSHFDMECEGCDASFRVDVDFEPVFYVRKDTLKLPDPMLTEDTSLPF